MSLIQCPDCGKDVSSNAEACPNCAAPIAKPETAKQGTSNSTADTRSALAQNELNSFGWGGLNFQLLLIGAGIGMYQESWYWFIGILLGGAILFAIPFLGKLMAVALSAGWGAAAAAIAASASENDETAMWVTGVVVFLLALGVNLAGVDHLRDISKG